MWKSLSAVLVHRVVLLALSFIAAKYVFAADTAQKLMAGDTVELWAGAPKISTHEIENYLLLVGIPAVISFAVAGWGRIKERFKLIKARQSPEVLTNTEVKEIAANASAKEIIQTVAAKP